MDLFLRFVVFLHNDFDGVGNLFVVVEQNLLANDFRHEEARRFVCPLVFAEIGLGLREQFLDSGHDGVRVELDFGGDGNDFRFREAVVPGFDQCFQVFLVAQVNFVDEHQDRHVHFGHFFDEVVVLVRFFDDIGDIEQHVSVLEC